MWMTFTFVYIVAIILFDTIEAFLMYWNFFIDGYFPTVWLATLLPAYGGLALWIIFYKSIDKSGRGWLTWGTVLVIVS
jgi:hypothetical protein